MRRTRILHLRASNFVGGPENQLLRHARVEQEQGGEFEITLGTFVGVGEGSALIQAAENLGLQTVSLPANSLVSSLRECARLLRHRKIDLICSHGYKADILGIALGRFTGIPVACFLRGWTGENRRVQFYEAADRVALLFANRVVCLSTSQAATLSKQAWLAKKIRIVTNAIDIPELDCEAKKRARSELRGRLGLPDSQLLVASAGRLSREKGLGDFLQAVSTTAPQFRDTRFVIFGEGVQRSQLERRSRDLGIDKQVIFAGFHGDLRDLLPGLDLLVNPSHSEVMPNIVLEAMAVGVPVIATRVGGVAEISGPHGALCLVPAGKPSRLAQEISQLLSDTGLRLRLGRAGRSRVKEGYSVDCQRAQFHALYREMTTSQIKPTFLRPQAPAVARSILEPALGEIERLPFVSVVIPVRNEERHIHQVLSRLESQEYPHDRFEILVADGKSTDSTPVIVETFARTSTTFVRLLNNPAQLSSAGRNIGTRQARGEFVIYVDGHCCIPSDSMLRDAVELFRTTGADCLCRPQPLEMPGNTSFQNVIARTRATPLGHGLDSMIYAAAAEGFVNPSSSGACYRRCVFERIGYYDEGFDACEDVEFNFRVLTANLKSYLSPRLKIIYQPRPTLRSLWQQMIRYGRGRYRLIRKHPRALSIGQIVPVLFLAWLVLAGAGSLFSSWILLMFFGTLLLYVGVVLAYTARLAIQYGIPYLVQAPAVYAAVHFGLGIGFLRELLSDLTRKRDPQNDSVDSVLNDGPLEPTADKEAMSAPAKGGRSGGRQVGTVKSQGIDGG